MNGPAAVGEREFVMPMPDGSSRVYIPQQMNSLSQLDYTYDSLQQPGAPAPPSGLSVQVQLAERFTRLGATAASMRVKEGARVTTRTNSGTARRQPTSGSDQRFRVHRRC